MDIEITSPARGFKVPSLVVLGLATPGIVVGIVALGPYLLVVLAGTLFLLWAVLRLTPSFSDRLHGGRRRPGVLLSAPAAVDHELGRFEVDSDFVSWTSHRRRGTEDKRFPIGELRVVTLQPQRGPQPSSLALIRLAGGRTLSVRIYASSPSIAAALNTAAT